MTPADLRRLSPLLDQALDLSLPERDKWLSALDVEAATLAPTLRELLAHHASRHTADLLDHGCAFTAPRESAPPTTFHVGEAIGPYRLLRPIGQGGMGEIWLAERSDAQPKRQVALKLPVLGMRRSVLVQRFNRERDILAALAHPHIARLYDAGLAEDGQPYLALEYVAGQTINAYSDAQRLDLRARLALLLQVMDAVQYAHANLVIHRDLKPSNVLVTADGQAMLLDFGIAKLLAADEATAEATEMTQVGGRALTLEYAAPEQVRGSAVSIATDVYALGVLFYELLSGRRPFGGTRGEIEAAILSAEPPPPAEVPADLATVVLKALKKAPAERYATVNAMAEDVGRWLRGEAVLAQPDSHAYRLRKFVGRNSVAVVTGVGVLATVIAASAISFSQASIAQAQARRARTVQALVVRLFSESDPEQAQGRSYSARELLDQRAAALSIGLQDEPETLAELEREIGRTYANLHDSATAITHLRTSVQAYERAGAADSEAAIEARLLLTQNLTIEAHLPEARTEAKRTLSQATGHLASAHPLSLRARLNLGGIYLRSGRAQEGSDQFRAVIAEMDKAKLPPSSLRLSALRALGRAQYSLEQLQDDLVTTGLIRQELAAISDAKIGTRLVVQLDELLLRTDLGQYAQVVQQMPQLVQQLEGHFGPASDLVHVARDYLALAFAALGQYDEAIGVQQSNMLNASKRNTADSEELAIHHFAYAQVLYEAGRYEEALVPARQSLALLDASPDSIEHISKNRALLGLLRQATGDSAGVVETRSAVAAYAALPGHESYASLAELLELLAVVEHASENRPAALDAATRALEIWIRRGSDAPATSRSRSDALTAWLRALAKPMDGQATAVWRESAGRYAAMRPSSHLAHAELLLMDAQLLRASGHPSESGEMERLGAQRWEQVTKHRLGGEVLTLH